MALRLWGTMMVPILFTVAFMWVFQVVFLERNYIESSIAEAQAQLEPLMEDLRVDDLACNERLLASLSSATSGKMLMVDQSGQLIAMYSFGHPIDLQENRTEILVWERIAGGEDYPKILAGEYYTRAVEENGRVRAYEIGVPVRYFGQEAYTILYHTFDELYTVLDMNRQQLIGLSVILTLAAAALAGLLARGFAGPILTIKGAVDRLTQGDLSAAPGLKQKDELGQLSHSVEELGQSLRRVDVLRKEVIANVSHELRSPLALIGGYAEMVKDITWRDEAKRNEDLDLIISESKRMSEMVSDILDYSQVQSGYLQLKKEAYDLGEIVESQVARCGQSAAENHVKLHMDCPEEPCPVRLDALKISQVIRNLIYNAVNHTEDGHTITVSLTRTGEGCRVSVVNPGEAIPEEERELIWERYQRSQHQGGRHQGTGIGLSIVSSILKAHGMSYGVDCRDGLTDFWFSCPLDT